MAILSFYNFFNFKNKNGVFPYDIISLINLMDVDVCINNISVHNCT